MYTKAEDKEMRHCTLEELLRENFNLVFVNALKQFWRTTKSFQCIGAAKRENLFLLLDGCKITYTDKEGNTVTATDGDVVYTPIGSEYRADLFDFQDERAHTVGINFFLYGEDGEPIILSEGIKIFHKADRQALNILFHRALSPDPLRSLIQNRIILMEILSCLSSSAMGDPIPDYIADAMLYMAEHLSDTPTVAALAKRYAISEVYFRKQFKRSVGMTPLDYRMSLRLARARSYLEYGDVSVQEISEILGYATVSHFIKEYRQRYGISPLQYRKLKRKN